MPLGVVKYDLQQRWRRWPKMRNLSWTLIIGFKTPKCRLAPLKLPSMATSVMALEISMTLNQAMRWLPPLSFHRPLEHVFIVDSDTVALILLPSSLRASYVSAYRA
jgi:hypothetical protein